MHERNRTKPPLQIEPDISVVGYASHLYEPQNEELAQQIGGSHYLIAWTGNEDIKIDRYDCRLYLTSLSEFDGVPNSSALDDELNGAEKLEEELCNEERYRDLCSDETVFPANEEKQEKRIGASICFDYNEAEEKSSKQRTPSKLFDLNLDEEDSSGQYEVQDGLKLPTGIFTPETNKQGAIIEKTASFIAKNGPQMEVVLKAKFGRSEFFGFLDFDHKLHPFYKYICKQIREGKYTPSVPVVVQTKKEKEIEGPIESEDEETDHSEDDGYLHPLLMGRANSNHPNTLAGDESQNGRESPRYGPESKPGEISTKNEMPPDLQDLIQKFHRDDKHPIYSTLLKGLHSVIPSLSEDVKTENSDVVEPNPEDDSSLQVSYEVDELKIQTYNKWHMEFYDRPSPYLPGPPPITIPCPPNMASSVSVAARYVAMNGPSAEQRLIDHNGESIEFLFPRSAYYTYYQSRVRYEQQMLCSRYMTVSNVGATTPEILILAGSPLHLQSSVPTTTLDSIPSPPAPPNNSSFVDAKTPIEMPVSDQPMEGPSKEAPPSSPIDELKQARKEKARLFMERILNERLSAKKKERNEEQKFSIASPIQQEITTADSSSAVQKSSLALTEAAISNIIDKHLQKLLPTSTSHSSQPSPEYKKKRRKRSRSRSVSHKRSHKKSNRKGKSHHRTPS